MTVSVKNIIFVHHEPFHITMTKKAKSKNGSDITRQHHGNIDSTKLMFMTAMYEMGISAEEYAEFLKGSAEDDFTKGFMPIESWSDNDFDDEDTDDCYLPSRRRRNITQYVAAMPAADKKSLRLKVQMKDVSTPPMWREIVIPADFNFSQLHYAIQAVTGLEDAHLWQFQRRPYDPELQIGVSSGNNDDFGIEEWTHNANETPVTGFLSKKGDKLVYVYDFGDDWIFTISVIDVIERESDVAICTKWKCDFQPIEDCGGVYAYLQLRDIAMSPENIDAKQKKEIIGQFGFNNFDTFTAWLDEAFIDIEYVNEMLAEIPDEWHGM